MAQVPMWRRYLCFWGPNLPADVDTELQFHLEMLTEKYVAEGMAPADARAQARRRFGDVTRVRTECLKVDERWETQKRRRDMLGALRQDVRHGVRMLTRSPAFTTVAVLSMALGIGFASTIFSAFNAAMVRPLPFRDPDRLVMVGSHTRNQNNMPLLWSTFEEWRETNTVFEQMAVAGAGRGQMSTTDGAAGTERILTFGQSPDVFQVLGTEALLGRTFVPGDGPEGHVVLSHWFWQQRFDGDPGVVGETLRVDGTTRVIVGVMPPGFWVYPWSDVALWTANERPVRVAAGIFEPYVDNLLILFGAVGMVLLVGCSNVATLLLARGVTRHKELATRAALGASRFRLVRQLVTESLLLSLGGGGDGSRLGAGAGGRTHAQQFLAGAQRGLGHPTRSPTPHVLRSAGPTLWAEGGRQPPRHATGRDLLRPRARTNSRVARRAVGGLDEPAPV